MFNSTEEALDYVSVCSLKDVDKLKFCRHNLINKALEAQKNKDYNQAMIYACRAQFVRECYELVQKKGATECMKRENML